MKRFGFYVVKRADVKLIAVDADSYVDAVREASHYAGHDFLFYRVGNDKMVHLNDEMRTKSFRLGVNMFKNMMEKLIGKFTD